MSSMGINQSELKDGHLSFDLIQNRIESLSTKMDTLIDIQEKVLNRLDSMESSEKPEEENGSAPKTVEQLMGREVRDICQELSTIVSVVNQRSEQQAQKLEGMEKLVLNMQQVISFIGETVKSSRVMQLMLKGPAARKGTKAKDSKAKVLKKKPSTEAVTKKTDAKLKDHKNKEGAEKPSLTPKSPKGQKKTKPPETDISLKKQALLLEEVQKLNRENSEKSTQPVTESPAPATDDVTSVVYYLPHDSERKTEPEPEERKEERKEERPEEKQEEAVREKEKEEKEEKEEEAVSKDQETSQVCAEEQPSTSSTDDTTLPQPKEPDGDQKMSTDEPATAAEDEEPETHEHNMASEGWAVFKAEGVEITLDLKKRVEEERSCTSHHEAECVEDEHAERFFIDTTPPPAAPFNHRIVSAKPNKISNFYTISWQEVLGGGRFGQVHKCVENSSGLTLAAKVIKARNGKEKEVVKNEIQVMNNLDHANLIQLYAAYESRNDIILVLEYVGGGELFDRIIDENYKLKELDAVVFIRQICEGLQHMHKMYVLHLDLKPENILCVSRVTNKVKIIDFGLARIYKPREKLQVNFGTPEFLAPEVINYDFVSFNTDMWSLGVITYMLLSGLCPFLGDTDNETLNNILACQWSFEEQEFSDTSPQAKDFISRLLIVNKSWRMSAAESLRHPWLSDPVLHHELHTKKTLCKSRRSSCVPDSNT
ncbi:myosin light chain kinase family member 4 isoform X2 [Periophthalmus magnuspinnatus]|uniref:myosin light chain kinase family member 4 isoform X2 n=1 Tax=Periophthalmus magnuspinnatus TaxID=409849 RepID=UPI00243679C7|nr:myosin light chain kinase family member 4 isoform X2 [Periophthalmus magnuspinnatus]